MELTLSSFFFDIPIYTPVEINGENKDVFLKIIDCFNKETFEGYNPWKQVESTFVVVTDLNASGSAFIDEGGHGKVEIRCKRTDDFFFYYILWTPATASLRSLNIGTLVKVGQYPSVADFHTSEIKQYRRLLSKDKLKEFSRAIGLAANGVGIGSFVYLRRIFEHLIAETYDVCLSEGIIKEEQFNRTRMDKKIELLSPHLPEFLVQNKSMYSVLSLGIHELDENTCLNYFDTLRLGIEIILDEKLDELKKKEKIQQAQKGLLELKKEASAS